MTDTPVAPVQIAIVGRGRLGSALAAALRRAGARVQGPLGRGADGREADMVLLCVPDGSVADAARAIAPGRLVGHCAGALTLAPLAPHEAFSIHPLLSVTGEDTPFEGAACAVAGSSEAALAAARALASLVGMQPVDVPDELRPLYHAAASAASNYLTTVEWLAERLFTHAGISRSDIVPLARSALDAWIARGAVAALTGPISRGDEATVRSQRAAVAAAEPQLLPLWDALAAATRQLADERRAGGPRG